MAPGADGRGPRALLGASRAGSLSPRCRRTTKGRVCPSGAGRAGRGAAFVPRVLSETSAAAQRASLCPWGRPGPRVTDAARRSAARRGARVARAPRRHGGRVWEVRASAFEVELLPCLNYVRPSVRSGPGAEARPSGGAGGARGPLFRAGEGGGGRVGPGRPALGTPSWSGAPRPAPGPPTTRAEVSGLREVAAEELGVRAVPPLCVYTWGERRSAGRFGRAAFRRGAVFW